jgi:hypothetical protein
MTVAAAALKESDFDRITGDLDNAEKKMRTLRAALALR